MSAADVQEIARLANIALAEVGRAETTRVGSDGNVWLDTDPIAYKAGLLATERVEGADWLAYCPGCFLHHDVSRCAKVAVRDALMGRTCGAA